MSQLGFLQDFLEYLRKRKYSEETIYNYERDLKLFDYYLQQNSLSFGRVDRAIMKDYGKYLLSQDRKTIEKHATAEKRLQSSSLNRFLSSVRSYLRWMIEMDYPVPIPPEAVKLVKTERRHAHVAEMNELVKVIEAPSSLENRKVLADRNRAMLEVLFSTGMRISELLSLNRTHIDHSGRIFIQGKGKKQRFVYMTPRAFTHLNEYLKHRTDNLQALFIPYRGKNSNDQAGYKRRISANYVQERIKFYREKLKINIPISPHSLRHGFATYLAENGANPAAIQILLGHESLDTTTRYVHASDRYAEETHGKFHPLKKD